MNLNELKIKAMETAINKGWNNGSSEHYICLVISELMEAVEADRKCKHANLNRFYSRVDRDNLKQFIDSWGEDFYNGIWKDEFEIHIKDTVEDELADAFIRLLHLAGLRNVYVGSCGITPYYTSNHHCFTEWAFDVVKDLVDYKLGLESEPILNGLSHILGYCLINKIDIESHVIEKMRYNELRDFDKAY